MELSITLYVVSTIVLASMTLNTHGVIIETIRRERGVCVRCEYPLRGLAVNVCPECGWIATSRRCKKLAIGWAVVFIVFQLVVIALVVSSYLSVKQLRH